MRYRYTITHTLEGEFSFDAELFLQLGKPLTNLEITLDETETASLQLFRIADALNGQRLESTAQFLRDVACDVKTYDALVAMRGTEYSRNGYVSEFIETRGKTIN